MEEKQDEFDLNEEYDKLKSKYPALPPFEDISEDFDVEKLYEKETNFILREIRRVISEKISAYMHFFETIINPASPPLFIFSILKGIDAEKKSKVESIYKKLAKFQIESMKLDTIYSEGKEAKHIEEVYLDWQVLKKDVFNIIESLQINLEDVKESVKSNYFG